MTPAVNRQPQAQFQVQTHFCEFWDTLLLIQYHIEVDIFDDLLQYGYDPSKTEDELRIEKNFEPDMVLRKLLPNPGPQNVHNLWGSVTSLIVLSHPLDRLVSLYNNKFIARVEVNQLWAHYAGYIKENYRKEEVGINM